MISITNAVFQTQIFIFALAVFLVATFRLRPAFKFDNSLTEELKGFAILAILFSHIGYFLVSDDHFLWPLSVAAGVGVNLFLLLSGYGLTLSSVKNPLSIKDFYLKRLIKLFVPLWIVLLVFLGLDFFVLNKTYGLDYLLQSFGGIYLTSNPAFDIDSPLWYFSLILLFYLIFPLVFRAKRVLVSALLLLIFSFLLLEIPLPLHADNIYLYKLHFISFPLGVALAGMKHKFKFPPIPFLRIALLIIFAIAAGYFAIHSGVGEGPSKEQTISVLSAILILLVFLFKNFQFKLLNLIGAYSYEIYLLHWPIIYRYDHFFKFLPASLAVIAYLAEFILLGILLQKFSGKIIQLVQKKP